MKRNELLRHLRNHRCDLAHKERHEGKRTTGRRSTVPGHIETPDQLPIKICKDQGVRRPDGTRHLRRKH